MVSNAEKQRLLKQFHHDPVYGVGVVLKCAACLLILVGLAIIGATADLTPRAPAVAGAASAPKHEQRQVSAANRESAHEDRRETQDRR